MCEFCGKAWETIESRYPCGPCPDEWKCPHCRKEVSPCCGAKILDTDCGDTRCEICEFCSIAICSECEAHCCCGGCI